MADPQYEFGGSDNAAIAEDRAKMWDAFTGATKYAVIAVVVILVGIYLLWG
ncbi:hypothetical protein [Plastoroseomonas arctica]|uniref:Aa3-type cytochrome c oxidase subunit IV n=1 Tax=Plastoroseomonas arctica TaxID=1509237 RepID=A0AAF1JYG5_9PROT|nr:hypothetical protein [Plastoroseomonas arctica]MBR0657017.1 hypothetical protein [Plastoroseomonas arctica]